MASSYLLLLAFDPFPSQWKSSLGGFAAVGAFVVPVGAPNTPGPRAITTCHRLPTAASSAQRCLLNRSRCSRRALLSVAPETETVVAENSARISSVTGREAVELAAERLAPLFAEVDAHTQR